MMAMKWAPAVAAVAARWPRFLDAWAQLGTLARDERLFTSHLIDLVAAVLRPATTTEASGGATEATGGTASFLAGEGALKFARCFTRRQDVVYCDHAFHGLTTGSLSINGSAEFRRGFDPLLPDTPMVCSSHGLDQSSDSPTLACGYPCRSRQTTRNPASRR